MSNVIVAEHFHYNSRPSFLVLLDNGNFCWIYDTTKVRPQSGFTLDKLLGAYPVEIMNDPEKFKFLDDLKEVDQ